MTAISSDTTLEELAVIISQTLESAGIPATLTGGSAVTIFTDNDYKSADLDFVTSDRLSDLDKAMAPLGFKRKGRVRQYEHQRTRYYVEFVSGPVAFGGHAVGYDDIPILQTRFGPLRIVTSGERLGLVVRARGRGADQAPDAKDGLTRRT